MDWLNYHHLRYFWVVAREGSLSGAARRMRVSAPSLSGQIRELEESLGVKLFRRSGRKNVLTDAGQIALHYADGIFSLGRELGGALKSGPEARLSRLTVGIVDSFPKLVTSEVLRPALALPAVHVVCREGNINDLLIDLAAHRLDMVLADEPAPSSLKSKVFNHALGESGISLCAAPALAAVLKRGFPRTLNGAPALLPAENSPLRRSLEKWFKQKKVKPRVVAEFDDLALMKVMAADEQGFVPIPTVVLREAVERYALQRIGQVEGCRDHYYAITAERSIQHPIVSLLTESAQSLLFR